MRPAPGHAPERRGEPAPNPTETPTQPPGPDPEKPLMFRGNHPATVDDKGRLKVPAAFLGRLRDEHEGRLFVTSPDGRSVWIYPMDRWERVEEDLREKGLWSRYSRQVNYFGQELDLDPQGRVLLPRRLRETAKTAGKVDVIGRGRFLEAWDHETLTTHLEADPLTAVDQEVLAEAGA